MPEMRKRKCAQKCDKNVAKEMRQKMLQRKCGHKDRGRGKL